MNDKPLSEKLFDGGFAENELAHSLSESGVTFERLGWDHYDNSLELYGVEPEARLSAEAQKIIHAAGFSKAYVNHTDKWETHYSFPEPFAEKKGWRVSYPHRRGEAHGKIWVEEHIPTWPQDWFKTGYVIIRKAAE